MTNEQAAGRAFAQAHARSHGNARRVIFVGEHVYAARSRAEAERMHGQRERLDRTWF
jgi:hypothetical protein